MGVYIPNMEMPKDGFITITVTSDGRVVGNSKKESGKFGYLDNEDIAKAVTVPPHGRLGDLDALIDKVIAKYLNFERNGKLVFAAAEIKQDICDLISDAPTIIPAEEGET